ncbi:CDPK-related kinase 5 [Asimina triloba]
MGVHHSKSSSTKRNPYAPREATHAENPTPSAAAPTNGAGRATPRREDREIGKRSPFFHFYSPSPARFFSKKSPAAAAAAAAPNASAQSTPRRFFRRAFPPPSPAKHIRAVLARRHGSVKPNEASIPEGSEAEGAVAGLDKSFGFSKHFGNKYELGEEVGRGHFGYTCSAKFKKGELKGQQVAVKVIPKAKVLLQFSKFLTASSFSALLF